MATLLLSNIEWDCPDADFQCLPQTVYAIGAPMNWNSREYDRALQAELSHVYGFHCRRLNLDELKPDGRSQGSPFRQAFDWKTVEAVMQAPKQPGESYTYHMQDASDGDGLKVRLEVRDNGLGVGFEGCGDHGTHDGYGTPLFIEVRDNVPFVCVWTDINEEDPQVISLEGAAKSRRTDHDEPDHHQPRVENEAGGVPSEEVTHPNQCSHCGLWFGDHNYISYYDKCQGCSEMDPG